MLSRILFGLFLFSFLSVTGQDVSFYKEKITMRIEKNSFYVTGTYYLKSETGDAITLVYPFPLDSVYGEIDSVYIISLISHERIIPAKQDRDKLLFAIDIPQGKDQVIQISYRQKLLSNRAEYILRSTIAWRKPLEQADYQLIVPKEISIVKFSIPPDRSMDAKEDRIYFWERNNFMPTVNMTFDFTEQ